MMSTSTGEYHVFFRRNHLFTLKIDWSTHRKVFYDLFSFDIRLTVT